jgi:hypothetical protein
LSKTLLVSATGSSALSLANSVMNSATSVRPSYWCCSLTTE